MRDGLAPSNQITNTNNREKGRETPAWLTLVYSRRLSRRCLTMSAAIGAGVARIALRKGGGAIGRPAID